MRLTGAIFSLLGLGLFNGVSAWATTDSIMDGGELWQLVAIHPV